MKPTFLVTMLVVAMLGLAAGVQAEVLAPGVNFTQYSASGPNNVYVVEIDRNHSQYRLEIGWQQHKRNYTSHSSGGVSSIAALYDNPPYHDVLAATNGSFYSTDPMGTIIGHAGSVGQLLVPASGSYETFMVGDSRQPTIYSGVKHINGTLTFANGTSIPLEQYNRDESIHKITAYTPEYDTSTRTVSAVVEVILTNVTYPMSSEKEVSGIVAAVRTGANAANNAIPAGGMVLSAWGMPATSIQNNTQVGDRLRMKFVVGTNATPTVPLEPYNNVDFAISGMGWILSGGVTNNANWSYYSANPQPGGAPFVGSRQPRTILAWKGDKTYMIVCDGRQTNSMGWTFAEAASWMTSTLGITDAVNMDGGGSSTMVVNGTLRNRPEGGTYQRPVANAVMLVKVAPVTYPSADSFPSTGRELAWNDKFSFCDVTAFSPTAPGGDGYVIKVANQAGGVNTVRGGDIGEADYSTQAHVYCEYRPEVAGDGYERYALFARDNGTGSLGMSNYGGGNCYALTYDSNTGRVQAGKYVNGTLTDFLAGTPLYMPSTAWRRFRIDCYGTTIRYSVDGNEIAAVNDSSFARGFYGLGYHEFFATNSNIRGTRADNFSVFIDVGPTIPVADFTATPTSGNAPLTVQFTDTSTGGPVTSWDWDFGDNMGSTAQNPSHIYTAPGTYNVSLMVTGDLGSDAKTRVGYITVTQAYAMADFDHDLDVDLDDYGHMQECYTGYLATVGPGCADADLDGDNRVTATDLAKLRSCFSGANIPADLDCGQ